MNMNSYSCCRVDSKNNQALRNLIPLVKIVGEENRLKILCILLRGEHCVCELQEHLGVSQSLLSHHLKDLKEAGIVSNRKEGLNVYYFLTANGKRVSGSLFNLVGV